MCAACELLWPAYLFASHGSKTMVKKMAQPRIALSDAEFLGALAHCKTCPCTGQVRHVEDSRNTRVKQDYGCTSKIPSAASENDLLRRRQLA